jgi:hypothetical protein
LKKSTTKTKKKKGERKKKRVEVALLVSNLDTQANNDVSLD